MEYFPIMRTGKYGSIPWHVIAPHEAQAMKNHGGQTLETLAERGGLCPSELLAVLEGRDWFSQSISEDNAMETIRVKFL